MGIGHYLKDIGRGKHGARSLTREQSHDLMGQILDGSVSDLELGAFCIAMRVKGESADELVGFMDAIHERLSHCSPSSVPTVVLPSYNGSRKLPVLTPLLGLLLAQQGFRVLLHGVSTDPKRVTSHDVVSLLVDQGIEHIKVIDGLQSLQADAGVYCIDIQHLLPALSRLLDVRSILGLRNSAHSLVKLIQPVPNAFLVSSYTHPEYLLSMGQVFKQTSQHAMLLRGTEGEPVADPRRTPQMDIFTQGHHHVVQDPQLGPLVQLPALPLCPSAASTAQFICEVLANPGRTPEPIRRQVNHIVHAIEASQCKSQEVTS